MFVMVTVLLAVVVFFGLALLVSAACERELIFAEREEKPQKVTHFLSGRAGESWARKN